MYGHVWTSGNLSVDCLQCIHLHTRVKMQGEEQFCHMDLTECIMEQVFNRLFYLLISMSGDFYADRQTDKHTQTEPITLPFAAHVCKEYLLRQALSN